MNTDKHQIIIGAHNALTGGTPANWISKVFHAFAKCQSKSFDQLLSETECRCWDIRLWLKDGEWHTGHGLLEYRLPFENPDILIHNIATYAKKPPYVRLVLERDGGEEQFAALCQSYQQIYGKQITFLGGRRKSDWALLFDFGTDDIPLQQWVSSMAADARWYEKFLPWLYAKRCNNRNLQQAVCGINLYDFL